VCSLINQNRLAALCATAVLALSATVQPAGAGGFSFAASLQSAAQAQQVPLPLLQAITYVNTRWEVIGKPAGDGGFLPMDIAPAQVAQAAALSGHSADQVKSDPAANVDAGAALLAHFHGSGTDLVSWKPAVVALLGPYVTTQVFEALQSGESRTTSAGESITLAPQAVAAPAPGPGAAAAVGGAAAPATTAAVPDYPLATWVPADPANYSTASRPHDYPVDMIVIHDTEGSYGSAIQEFQNPATAASAHYVVSDLGQITQMVAEHDVAWHAGNWDYNIRSIGIEHEGFASGPNWYTTAMYQASAHLAASICSRWGVPMDRTHVIGHYEVPDPDNPGQFGGSGHHTDPGVNWDWTTYMGLAQTYASQLPSPPRLGPDPVGRPGNQTVALSWQAAHTCYAPITGYTIVMQPGNVTQTVASSVTSATFAGLKNGTAYTFTVTAHNAQGQDSLTSDPVVPSPLPFAGLYTIDAFGGVHADESASLPSSAYWPGWPIARAGKTLPAASGTPQTGFVLDGWGGLHRFGAATITETSPSGGHYWNGWDIARDFAFLPNGTGGFVLDGYGGLHPFHLNGNSGPLQAVGNSYLGWDIARKVVIFADGSGGYVLDGWGGLHPFGINGPAPASVATLAGGSYWQGWDIARDLVLMPGDGNHSGYVLDGYGGAHPFHPTADGSVMPAPIKGTYLGWDIARSLWLASSSVAATPKGYVMDGWGELIPFGSVGVPASSVWNGWDIAIGLTGQ
jgi:N-acetylmuramoyl-L-alanine amidase/Fibronectin type III domain